MDFLGGVFSGIGNAFAANISANAQREINAANIKSQEKINQQNIDFAMQEANIMRQREDTAHLREVQDLQSAGLSPLASLGGSNASSAALPDITAPTQDATGFINAANSIASAGDGFANGLYAAQRSKNAKELQDAELKHDFNKTQVNLLESARQFDKSQDNEMSKFSQNLKYLISTQKDNFTVSTRDQAIKLLESEKNDVRRIFGDGVKFDYISDEKDYKSALSRWNDNFTIWLDEHRDMLVDVSESSSDTTSANGGFNVGAFQVANVGSNAGVTTGSSSSSSIYRSREYQAEFAKFISANPYPLRSSNLLYKYGN